MPNLSHILVSFPFSSLLSRQRILPPSCIAASLSKVDAHRLNAPWARYTPIRPSALPPRCQKSTARPADSLHTHPPSCLTASLPKVDGRRPVLCTPRGLFSTLIRPHRRRLAPQVEERPFNVPTALHHRCLGSWSRRQAHRTLPGLASHQCNTAHPCHHTDPKINNKSCGCQSAQSASHLDSVITCYHSNVITFPALNLI